MIIVLTLHIRAGLPSSNARPDPVDKVGQESSSSPHRKAGLQNSGSLSFAVHPVLYT